MKTLIKHKDAVYFAAWTIIPFGVFLAVFLSTFPFN
jgi:hypothetical protein